MKKTGMKKTSLIIGILLFFGAGVWGVKWLQGIQDASAATPASANPNVNQGRAAQSANPPRRDAQVPQAQDAQERPQRPPFELPDMQGVSRHIKTWDGKVLVVNFWATWCGPCLREIPAFVDLQKKYGDKGLQFVGVAFDDLEAIQGFTKTSKIQFNYPILIGEDDAMTIAAIYGNTIGALPYTVIIDRKGKIVHGQIGEISRRSVEDIIKPLL